MAVEQGKNMLLFTSNRTRHVLFITAVHASRGPPVLGFRWARIAAGRRSSRADRHKGTVHGSGARTASRRMLSLWLSRALRRSSSTSAARRRSAWRRASSSCNAGRGEGATAATRPALPEPRAPLQTPRAVRLCPDCARAFLASRVCLSVCTQTAPRRPASHPLTRCRTASSRTTDLICDASRKEKRGIAARRRRLNEGLGFAGQRRRRNRTLFCSDKQLCV
jgi:hypothetical protein